MLRILLGEPPRVNSGLLGEAMDNMSQMAALLRKEMKSNQDRDHVYRQLEIWTRGLISSLDELEQSWFAASFFRRSVNTENLDDMPVTEQGEYARYVYFYKNGFIRVFSLLDKLGIVLNTMYDLKTNKVKPHFSYFTVLRQFHITNEYVSLIAKLDRIKDAYHVPLQNLRKRRNSEIHYMNSEMEDDLWQRHKGLNDKVKLEDLDAHLEDLRQGLNMVCKSLTAAYQYSLEQWRKDVSRH